jgi:hypothetical protein
VDKSKLLKNVLNVIANTSSANSKNYQTTSECSSASAVATRGRKHNEAKAANAFVNRWAMPWPPCCMHPFLLNLDRLNLSQSMKYQELFIMTDNERLKQLYNKFAKREDKCILEEIQQELDRMKHHCTTTSESDDEDE